MAEREGFEPSVRVSSRTHDFQSCSFSLSDISPVSVLYHTCQFLLKAIHVMGLSPSSIHGFSSFPATCSQNVEGVGTFSCALDYRASSRRHGIKWMRVLCILRKSSPFEERRIGQKLEATVVRAVLPPSEGLSRFEQQI